MKIDENIFKNHKNGLWKMSNEKTNRLWLKIANENISKPFVFLLNSSVESFDLKRCSLAAVKFIQAGVNDSLET